MSFTINEVPFGDQLIIGSFYLASNISYVFYMKLQTESDWIRVPDMNDLDIVINNKLLEHASFQEI